MLLSLHLSVFTFLAADGFTFILQPVVMARFLDQSWQLLLVDS